MLRTIETGASWPEQLLTVRCCWLAKKAWHSPDPLHYRGLLVMSALYRAWAKAKLGGLQAWISSWEDPALFSGRAGFGAADAWHGYSMLIEEAVRCKRPVALTAIDLAKCFDQINRQVLLAMLCASGCPHDVLAGYYSHVEAIGIFSEYAAGIGQVRTRRTGIPQ
eukprot:8156079-Alexandrium_andersonii.AAC.1